MTTTEEIESTVSDLLPSARCQASLRGGLQGVLVAIGQEAAWIPLDDDVEAIIHKLNKINEQA